MVGKRWLPEAQGDRVRRCEAGDVGAEPAPGRKENGGGRRSARGEDGPQLDRAEAGEIARDREHEVRPALAAGGDTALHGGGVAVATLLAHDPGSRRLREPRRRPVPGDDEELLEA